MDELQPVRLGQGALDVLMPLLCKHQGPPARPARVGSSGQWACTEAIVTDALGESVQAKEAEVAVHAAAAGGFWAVVRSALTHPRAAARQRALEYVTSGTNKDLPPDVVALAQDPSASVRRSVLELLAEKPERYASALVPLCKDTWARASRPQGGDKSFPLARTAARALATLTAVPAELSVPIVEASLETDDSTVTELLLQLLANRGDEDAVQEVINLIFTIKPTWASVQAAKAIALSKSKVPADALQRLRRSPDPGDCPDAGPK